MKKNVTIIFLCLFISIMSSLAGCNSKAEIVTEENDLNEEKVVRIGYQKNGPLVILRGLGLLEERLEGTDFKVEWIEFQSGPQLVEALNVGSIDVGRTGNSPVIFAQAAGTPFTVLAAGKPKYHGSGVLVPNDSNIKSLEDLKGKTVSFAKGSSSHFLIVKALESAGLHYSDITPAFLSPGDARVAFEQGNVDAMVVWDPFTASSEIHSDAKLLVTGEGLSTDRDFFIATEQFAEKHMDIANIIVEEIANSSEWANNNHEELIPMLVPILSLDEASIKVTVERREYGVDHISEQIIEEQQDIADTFYELDIIPTKVNVRDVMEK